jgi:ABC-type Fe3+/spermidine/putrescine transport system ATPase subunit
MRVALARALFVEPDLLLLDVSVYAPVQQVHEGEVLPDEIAYDHVLLLK